MPSRKILSPLRRRSPVKSQSSFNSSKSKLSSSRSRSPKSPNSKVTLSAKDKRTIDNIINEVKHIENMQRNSLLKKKSPRRSPRRF